MHHGSRSSGKSADGHLLGQGLVHDDGKGGVEGGVISEHAGAGGDQVGNLDVGLQHSQASCRSVGGVSQGIV